MSPAGLHVIPALLLVLGEPPVPPSPPVVFRGDPAHTGVAAGDVFGGQGGVRWRVRTDGAVRSSPAVTATRVYVGSGDGNLYAIDRRGGTVAWRFQAGGPVDASPAVAAGLVIAATSGGRIFRPDRRARRRRVHARPRHRTAALARDDRRAFQMEPSVVGTPLALDREGKASAWVYSYRADRPGSGYVQLWGFGATAERLSMIQAAAEFGLLRRQPEPRDREERQ